MIDPEAATKSAPPRWFQFLRLLFYITIALFALSVVYSLPLNLAARLGPGVNAYDFANWTFLIGGVALLAGMVLCLVLLVAVVVTRFVFSRRRPSPEIPWQRLGLPALLAAVGAILALLDLLLSPPIPFEFLPVVSVFNPCTYEFQVVAFQDQNANGLRDPNEPGLSNVNITVNYPDPKTASNSTPTYVSQSAVTDINGLATVGVAYAPCASSELVAGHSTIRVETPAGYVPTTLTTFGPLSSPTRYGGPTGDSHISLTQYVGFTKPS